MHKFNYRKKPVGRPRSAPVMRNIALVHPSLPSEPDEVALSRAVTLQWLNDIRRQLTVANHHLCLFGGHSRVEQDVLFCEVTRRHELDGVLLLGARHDGYLDWIQKYQLPVVLINRQQTDHHASTSYVCIDNKAGGMQAAEHLLELGHQRMAILADDPSLSFTADRIAGFEQACTQAHTPTPLPHVHVVGSYPRQEQLQLLVRQMRQDGITAVFCTCDSLAGDWMQACHAVGMRVPCELSVIGFDALPIRSEQDVLVTSIGFDRRMIADMAIDLMLKMIDSLGKLRTLSAIINTQLVLGTSTAGPKLR
jgi:LacI family transcriptional regulator